MQAELKSRIASLNRTLVGLKQSIVNTMAHTHFPQADRVVANVDDVISKPFYINDAGATPTVPFVPNRIPLHHAYTVWTEEENKLLLKAVKEQKDTPSCSSSSSSSASSSFSSSAEEINWQLVADRFGGTRTAADCNYRWTAIKPGSLFEHSKTAPSYDDVARLVAEGRSWIEIGSQLQAPAITCMSVYKKKTKPQFQFTEASRCVCTYGDLSSSV